MLFDLPSDLSLCILQDWLADLKCLAALDAASAPSVRSDYLGLVAQPAFVHSSPVVIDKDKSPKKLISWINTRMVKLSALVSDAAMLKQCAKISFAYLRTVRKLKVCSRPGGQNNGFEPDWFRRLLGLLPQLRVVDFGEFVPTNAEYVAVLTSSALSLSAVLLDNSLESCDGIGALIAAHGSTLTVASFGSERCIDTPTMNLIASTCKIIKKLTITCELSSTQDYATVFASDCLPLLERLGMCCVDSQPTEETIKAMFRHHPLLICADFVSSAFTPTTCATIITLSPNVAHFACAGFAFNAVCDESNDQFQHSELTFDQDKDDFYPSQMYLDCVAQLSSSCLHPLTHVDFVGAAFLTNEDFLTVVTVLGKHLKSFTTDLNGTGDDDNIVQHIALLCPSLEALFLNSTNCMTDVALNAVADNCKSLTALSFHEGKLLTDFGMCFLLSRIGDQLVDLRLVACSLSSVTFVAILSLCRKLTVLELYRAGVSSDAIQVHLLSSTQNRLPKVEKLLVDKKAFDVLMAFVNNPVNAVNAKWAMILHGR